MKNLSCTVKIIWYNSIERILPTYIPLYIYFVDIKRFVKKRILNPLDFDSFWVKGFLYILFSGFKGCLLAMNHATLF
jgi:hypothetical protein